MPPKRRRGKKADSPSESKQQPEARPSKRRKQVEHEEVVKNGEEVVGDIEEDQTSTGKAKRGESKKRATGNKRKRNPSNSEDINGGQRDKILPEKAAKISRKKTKTAVPSEESVKHMKVTKPKKLNYRMKQGSEDVAAMQRTIGHSSHSITAGTVLVMGQGDCGQLGLGENMTERKKPFPVKGELLDKRVIQVECGGMHTVALTDEGKVYTWGCNDEGALGYELLDGESYVPRQVKALDDFKVVQVSAGDCHTTALVENGQVYCWGVFRDSNGPIGMVGSSPTTEPQLVYKTASYNSPAVKIVSGDNHVMFLTETGEVYTFGSGEQGQLGRLAEIFCSRGGRQGLDLFFTPQSVRIKRRRAMKPLVFCDIFAGSFTSFAVAKDKNTVYAWGLNNYKQLGLDIEGEVVYSPEKVPEDWLWSWANKGSSSVTDNGTVLPGLCISGAIHHSLVCDNGKVYSMGSKNYGRLGLGKLQYDASIPTEIKITQDEYAVGVASSGSCSFAVTKSGNGYSWGMGSTLQLGHSDDSDYWEPTKITGKNLEGKKVISISCGGQHTALLVTEE